jgi:hypothetical protein
MLRRKLRREKLKQLYGTGSANNHPQGLVGLAGVQSIAIDPANLHPSFCAGEKLIEDANFEMTSYGVIVLQWLRVSSSKTFFLFVTGEVDLAKHPRYHHDRRVKGP